MIARTADSVCADCGLSHRRDARLARLRRLLPCTVPSIREAFPCTYPTSDCATLFRDLRLVGAVRRRNGEWFIP